MYIFKNLNDDKKTAFFLALAMKTVSLLNEVQKNIAENALDYCWKWLDRKVPDADFLYGLLIDKQAVWNCITDASPLQAEKRTNMKIQNTILNLLNSLTMKLFYILWNVTTAVFRTIRM